MYRQRHPDDPGMHSNPILPGRQRSGSAVAGLAQQSLVITLIGMALVLGSVALLAWNEGRAVQTMRSLEEALRLLVELKTPEVIIEDNNGRLVHLSGSLQCDQILSDKDFAVAINAVQLARTVEMYQWVEREHNEEQDSAEGKVTIKTYSYDTEWRKELVYSSSFDNQVLHHNPSVMPVESKLFMSSKVRLGTFWLSKNIIAKVVNYQDFEPKFVPEHRPELKIHGKYFYFSENPSFPEVGDYRVSYAYAGLCKDGPRGKADIVSVIAKQAGMELTGYQTDTGDTLEMLELGSKSAQAMIHSAQSQNIMLTWFIRASGLLLSFCGFSCLTSLVYSLVSWIPIIREIAAIGYVTMNVCLSVSVSMATVAMSWCLFRPWYALAVIVLTVVPMLALRVFGHAAGHTQSYQRRYV